MSDRLTSWEFKIFKIGLFVFFLVTFGDYLWKKIGPVLNAWFGP